MFVFPTLDEAFIDRGCGFFVEADAIASNHRIGAGCFQMMPQMVGGQYAIAINEQQIWSGAGQHALVAGASELKSIVLVRCEGKRKRGVARKGLNHVESFIG